MEHEKELDEILTSRKCLGKYAEDCEPCVNFRRRLLKWRNKRDEGMEERVKKVATELYVMSSQHEPWEDKAFRAILQAIKGTEVCDKCGK